MSNAYMIEAGDETAGVVVREGQRFRFLSSSPRFWSLDGEYYRSPKEAERATLALLTVRAFAIDEETLDAKTICRFRLALVAAEVPERLFAELDRQLPAKGVVRQERHTDRRDELAEHHPDARFHPPRAEEPVRRQGAIAVDQGSDLIGCVALTAVGQNLARSAVGIRRRDRRVC